MEKKGANINQKGIKADKGRGGKMAVLELRVTVYSKEEAQGGHANR